MNGRVIFDLRAVCLAAAWCAVGTSAFAQTPIPVESPPAPFETPPSVETPTPAPAEPMPATQTASPIATPPATTIGGHGELHYANVNGREQGARVDARLLVFRVAHRFHDRLSAVSEIAIEHGEDVEVEQTFLEYRWRRWLGVRGGLLLVPVGVLNGRHESPMFHGVERNGVDTVLIPTTWREVGVAFAGEPVDGVRWQVAFFNGLNAGGLSGDRGLRGARSESAESASNDGAVAVRLEYAALPGVDVGASFYEGGAGRQEIDESVSVRIVEVDARVRRSGAAVSAQAVHVRIDGADAVNDFLATGSAPVPAIGTGMQGFYVECAYDVLAVARPRVPRLGVAELSPFARYEATHTQLGMPEPYLSDGAFDRTAVTAGLTFRPLPTVALKAEYEWTFAAEGDPENVWRLGFGFAF